MATLFAYASVLVAVVGMTGCSKPATGSENAACYPNDTCNAGLECVLDTCVKSSSLDMTPAGSGDMTVGAMDAATFNDAGMPCPGASIFHPGTETRKAGTVVPFVGRGRDPTCAPITGANLVWVDSIDMQIGTGETFDHTFTQTGMHTVTLTAKDGPASYTAMITFMIN